MKKTLLLLILLCIVAVRSYSQIPNTYVGTPIPMTVSWHDPFYGGIKFPKAPLHIQAPDITLDGNTLFIYSNHPDYVLQLVSADETVVFKTYVSADTYQVELPANLTGEYELQLQTVSYAFVGYVEL